MNVLILIKNGPLDQSIINFTSSLLNAEGVAFHLLNIVTTNGEVPTKKNGHILDFCTEFDLSQYIAKTEKNLRYMEQIVHASIVKRNSFAGNKTRIIQDYIKTNAIELIVGGAHKTTVMEDVFIHTFASSVIENTSLPFFTIKCNRDNFVPKKIALIGDFLKIEKEELSSIKQIAAIHKSEIVLTKVRTQSEKRSKKEIEKAMQRYADTNELTATYNILDSSDKEAGIAVLHNDHVTDLIAIARTHKKSFFKILGQSELTNIINHIYAPILIY